MDQQLDIIGEAGIQFFGKISASISHEFKNALAIINENAGLLDDFMLMAEKGVPIEPERLKFPTENIAKQIHRANEIVKRMNEFSHSTDEPVKTVDMGEMAAFMAAISERFAAIRTITLKAVPPEKPVRITTHPFLLEALIFQCLNFAMDAVKGGKTIRLIPEKTDTGARLRFADLEGLAELQRNFPDEKEIALLAFLKAEITTDTNAGELILKIEN